MGAKVEVKKDSGNSEVTKLDKMSLNNFVVKRRGLAQQAKIQIVKRLMSKVRLLRKKKMTAENETGKITREAISWLKEVTFIKDLDEDEIMKFALLRKKSFEDVINNPEAKMEEKALCRLADHEELNSAIMDLRNQHANWEKEIPFLIKGLGIRHREQKLKRLKKLGKLEVYLEQERKNLKILQEFTEIDINPDILQETQDSSEETRKQNSSNNGTTKKKTKKNNKVLGMTDANTNSSLEDNNREEKEASRHLDDTLNDEDDTCTSDSVMDKESTLNIFDEGTNGTPANDNSKNEQKQSRQSPEDNEEGSESIDKVITKKSKNKKVKPKAKARGRVGVEQPDHEKITGKTIASGKIKVKREVSNDEKDFFIKTTKGQKRKIDDKVLGVMDANTNSNHEDNNREEKEASRHLDDTLNDEDDTCTSDSVMDKESTLNIFDEGTNGTPANDNSKNEQKQSRQSPEDNEEGSESIDKVITKKSKNKKVKPKAKARGRVGVEQPDHEKITGKTIASGKIKVKREVSDEEEDFFIKTTKGQKRKTDESGEKEEKKEVKKGGSGFFVGFEDGGNDKEEEDEEDDIPVDSSKYFRANMFRDNNSQENGGLGRGRGRGEMWRGRGRRDGWQAQGGNWQQENSRGGRNQWGGMERRKPWAGGDRRGPSRARGGRGFGRGRFADRFQSGDNSANLISVPEKTMGSSETSEKVEKQSESLLRPAYLINGNQHQHKTSFKKPAESFTHPSWTAKKLQRQPILSLQGFQGKHKVFD
ncbi:hypothetical protein Pmani_005338 [Petrolisthes manimaculis]|uniref:Serum response factor-binding protein 1 n=1 Tax=Petrolisthes manimaculis TaxID=1843537 RepID=A0AAE1UMA7_9EUCA|nr:hypothetical protein Pmani_005338 [Petrolisthes manimaculis]